MRLKGYGIFTGLQTIKKKDGEGSFTILHFLGDDDGKTIDLFSNDGILNASFEHMKPYNLDLSYTVNNGRSNLNLQGASPVSPASK